MDSRPDVGQSMLPSFVITHADGEEAPIPAIPKPATRLPGSTNTVQGFGYRPVDDLSARAYGRGPKACREGTRGGAGSGKDPAGGRGQGRNPRGGGVGGLL